MSDAVELTLRLNDQVSNAAARAAGALKKAESQAKKTQQALGFGKDIGRSLDKLNKLKLDPGGFKELQRLNKEIAEQKKKLSGGFFSGLGKGLFGWAGPQGAARLWSNVAGAVIADSIVGGARAAADLFADGVRKAFSYGADYEKLNLSYELLLGKKGGAAATADISRFAGKTAYDDDEIRQIMRPLFLAGMSVNQGRAAFAASADLAAAGANVNEVADAFAKIQQGGGIRKLQLQSFGVNVPDLYKTLGKQLGVSSKEVESRASQVYGGAGSGRGIDPQILLNAIYSSIEKRQGGILGTGAERAGQTMAGQWHKLMALPGNYLKMIAEAPGWKRLSSKIGDVLKQLDPDGPQGKRIISSLMSAFNTLADLIGRALKPENIQKFADGIETAVDYLKDAPKYIDFVSEASKVLLTLWVGSKITGIVTGIAELRTAFMGLSAANAPLLAVAAAFTSIAYAIYKIADAADKLGGWGAVKRDLIDWWHGDAPATGHGTHALTAAQVAGGRADVAMLARNAGDRPNSAVTAAGVDMVLRGKPAQTSGQILVAQNVTIHPAANDTEHTRQSITTVTADGAQRGAERALQGMSGK